MQRPVPTYGVVFLNHEQQKDYDYYMELVSVVNRLQFTKYPRWLITGDELWFKQLTESGWTRTATVKELLEMKKVLEVENTLDDN